MTDLNKLTATCAACGRTTEVPMEFAGRVGRCNGCGGQVRVPSLFDDDEEPVPPPAAPAPAPRPGTAAVPRPGTAAVPRPGTAAVPRPGTATTARPGTARTAAPSRPAEPAAPTAPRARVTQLGQAITARVQRCRQHAARLKPITWSLIAAGGFALGGLLLGVTASSAPADRPVSETDLVPPSEPLAFTATSGTRTALILVFPSLTWGKPAGPPTTFGRLGALAEATDRSVTIAPPTPTDSLVQLISQTNRNIPPWEQANRTILSWEQANGVLAGRRLDGWARDLDLTAQVLDRAPREALAIEITNCRFARLGVTRTSGLLPTYLAPLAQETVDGNGYGGVWPLPETDAAPAHLRLAGISPGQLRAGLRQYAEAWRTGDADTLLASDDASPGLRLVQRFLYARYFRPQRNDLHNTVPEALGQSERVILSLREADAFGEDGAFTILRKSGWTIAALPRQELAAFPQRWILSGVKSPTGRNLSGEVNSLLHDHLDLTKLSVEQLRVALGGYPVDTVVAELARRGAAGWDVLEAYIVENHDLRLERGQALLELMRAPDAEARAKRLRAVIDTNNRSANYVGPLNGEMALPRLAALGAAGAEAVRFLGPLLYCDTSTGRHEVGGEFGTACRDADPDFVFITALVVGSERDPAGPQFQAARLWLNHGLVRAPSAAAAARMVQCWRIVQARVLHDGLPQFYESPKFAFTAIRACAEPLLGLPVYPPALTAPAGREVLLALFKQWPETDLNALVERAGTSPDAPTRALAQEALAVLAAAPTAIDQVASDDASAQMRGWRKLFLSNKPAESFRQILAACASGRITAERIDGMLFFDDGFANHPLAEELPNAHAVLTRPGLAPERRRAVALALSLIRSPEAQAEFAQLAHDPDAELAQLVAHRIAQHNEMHPPPKPRSGTGASP